VRGYLPDGRDSDDLLSAAVTAALSGKRCWNPSKVPFSTFLIGTMRSLANHARKARVTDILQIAVSESEPVTPKDPIPLDNISPADPHAFGSAAPRR
jgi:DNA-directed RNA polymerase specialized sigma24 family protein